MHSGDLKLNLHSHIQSRSRFSLAASEVSLIRVCRAAIANRLHTYRRVVVLTPGYRCLTTVEL